MSKNAVPLPIQNPVLDDGSNRFSLTYQRVLKNLFDDWVSENQLKDLGPLKYSINGNVCFYNFNRLESDVGKNLSITLPYPLKVPTKVNGVLYNAGTKTITIESTVTYIDGWYFVDFLS